MRRVLLDSNALDPLMYVPGAFELLRDAVESGELEILVTHVTIDEMAATPDLDKRQWLLVLLFALGRMIDTSGAIVDFSRVNFCRVMDDDDESIDILRSASVRHSRDALIAHTALMEGCALITNEKRLTARARDKDVEVLTTTELLAEFGLAFPVSHQGDDPSREAVLAAVSGALADLAARDQALLELRAHELAVVHRFAVYLERHLRQMLAQHDLTIDIDYDRHGRLHKFLDPRDDRRKAARFRPDLVVHGRGDDDRNILVMEWKKNARNRTLARLRSRVEQLLISDASHSGYSYKIGVLVDVRAERIKWRTVEIGQTDDTWTTIPVPNSASGQ